MYKSEHTGAHAHNIPLMVAPVQYTNFKNFHFRKWCSKKDDTACSTYNVVKESDSSQGSTDQNCTSDTYSGHIQSISYKLYDIVNMIWTRV